MTVVDPDRRAEVAPPTAVLEAFDCRAEVAALPGGEGRSWRAGEVVLKPADEPRQVCWSSEVLGAIDPAGVVIPRPLRAGDGAWVVDGWFATEYIADAQHQPRRWHDILAAGRTFHAALASVARPDWMDDADDWWRRADRVAWESGEAVGDGQLVGLVERLRVLRKSMPAPRDQIVHGDLCGNVLFDGRGRPVVIDFSPYWRPVEWASAVVAVDAFEWEGAGAQALHWLDAVADGYQLLLRAAIYRIATSAEVAAARGLEDRKLAVHGATVDALERLFREQG